MGLSTSEARLGSDRRPELLQGVVVVGGDGDDPVV
jgi:hypothetical protein